MGYFKEDISESHCPSSGLDGSYLTRRNVYALRPLGAGVVSLHLQEPVLLPELNYAPRLLHWYVCSGEAIYTSFTVSTTAIGKHQE